MKDTIKAFITPCLPTRLQRSTNRPSQICMNDEKDSAGEGSAKPKEGSKKPMKTVRSSASWSDNFFPEFGRKGPGSRPDWDLRPKSLRIDDEDDKAGICDNCKGTGVMVCSFCMGGDFHSMDDSMMKCPACASKKEVTCSVCFGSKKQVEMVRLIKKLFLLVYLFAGD